MIDLFFNNNMNIYEKKYRLKYLYLINVDEAIKRIKDSDEYKEALPDSSNKDALFHRIFDVIFSISSNYNRFFNYQNYYPYTFLGCPKSKRLLYQRQLILLVLCLRNHCITKGLFTSLLSEEHNTISLSGSNDNWNEAGYFATIHNKKKDFSVDSTSTIYQSYNSIYANRYKHSNLNTEYPYYIINQCSLVEAGKTPKILSCLRNPLLFLYKERSVSDFNRSLQKESTTRNFLNTYAALYEKYIIKSKEYNDKRDKFIFNYLGEDIYDFSTLRYIAQLLTEINKTHPSYTGELSGKDLEGSALNNVLISVMNCPLVYARNFLLKHTYTTILDSDLAKAYLEYPVNSAVIYDLNDFTDKDKVKKISRAITLSQHFFNTINKYTVPILEDLWDVMIHEINSQSDEPVIAQKNYVEYLNTHYNLLTADYSDLTEEDLKLCIDLDPSKSESQFDTDNSFNIGISHRLQSSVLQKLIEHQISSSIEKEFNYQAYLYGDAPAYVKQSLQTILKNSLTPSRFKSEINNSLFPDKHNDTLQPPSRLDQFKQDHIKELYNFYL